ncbi:MAG: hypothetical protein AB7Q97_01025 [Gammaproteobacteria bacterium]
MLAVKIVLVPAFLLLVSVAGRIFGPTAAGWLSGLPVVTGPVLVLLAIENGPAFGADASWAAVSAAFASMAFSLAYAHAAMRVGWPLALSAGLTAWLGAAIVLQHVPDAPLLSLAIGAASLGLSPRLFPRTALSSAPRSIGNLEIALRMVAGAAITLASTALAAVAGSRWSGVLAVFPVLGTILAVFTHRSGGHALTALLLRAMATGMFSFLAFCATFAATLPHLNLSLALAAALSACLCTQAATGRLLASRHARSARHPA